MMWESGSRYRGERPGSGGPAAPQVPQRAGGSMAHGLRPGGHYRSRMRVVPASTANSRLSTGVYRADVSRRLLARTIANAGASGVGMPGYPSQATDLFIVASDQRPTAGRSRRGSANCRESDRRAFLRCSGDAERGFQTHSQDPRERASRKSLGSSFHGNACRAVFAASTENGERCGTGASYTDTSGIEATTNMNTHRPGFTFSSKDPVRGESRCAPGGRWQWSLAKTPA
jgi:hypothetical protein